MSVDLEIKTFTNKVVVIDDGFEPARLEAIQDEDWANLRDQEDPLQWEPIKNTHFPKLERVMDLKRDSDALKKAWGLYEKDPSSYQLLDPIFGQLLERKHAETSRLHALLDYFESDLGIDVRKHASIESAISDIKDCRLVFLDFYLYQTSSDDVIEKIKEYGDLFCAPVTSDETKQGRIVFLISTALPPPEKIELFRRATSLKGAFFKPLPKDALSKDRIRAEVSTKVERYDDMQRWMQYLETFSRQIKDSAESLRGEIDGLELHDLAILDSLRLQKDSEDLGDYLSWLFSDALAARIRQAAPLTRAEEDVDKIESSPFQGMLMPKPILFGLYSDIAFTPFGIESSMERVHFGDVLSPVDASKVEGGQAKGNEDAQPASNINLQSNGADRQKVKLLNELLLVIAPACDLQRCRSDYEVLCVRGYITKHAADLADLLGQQVFIGKNAETIRHLMHQEDGAKVNYCTVEWRPKQITTIPAASLLDAKRYRRRARLNELLCHEVKEEALRQVGRVGVPVDPSFSAALGAVIRIRRPKKTTYVKQVLDSDFVPALFISANEQNPARLLLSEQFLHFLNDVINEIESWDPPVNQKILVTLRDLYQTGAKGIQLGTNNRKDFDGGFKVRLVESYNTGDTSKESEIVFYPRGRVSEAEELSNTSVRMMAVAESLATVANSVANAAETVAAAAEEIAEGQSGAPEM